MNLINNKTELKFNSTDISFEIYHSSYDSISSMYEGDVQTIIINKYELRRY